MRSIRVAAIQPKPIGELNSPNNLPHAISLLETVAKQNVQIACFPEYYPWHGENELCEMARSLNIYIVAGLAFCENDRIYNTATLIDHRGQIIGRQKKANLGHLEIKTFGFLPGDRAYHVFDTDLGKLGLGVCVDFWHTTECGKSLADQGADLIINPSFVFFFQSVWPSFVITRAIDNFVPVVAIDHAQFHFKTETLSYPKACGSGSFVFQMPRWKNLEEFSLWFRSDPDPTSWVSEKLGSDEGLLISSIDLNVAKQFKAEWFYRLGVREKIPPQRSADYLRLAKLNHL